VTGWASFCRQRFRPRFKPKQFNPSWQK